MKMRAATRRCQASGLTRQVTTNDDDCEYLPRRRPRHDCYPLTRVAAFSRARCCSAGVGFARPKPLRSRAAQLYDPSTALLAIRVTCSPRRGEGASLLDISPNPSAHPLFTRAMKNFRSRDNARRRRKMEGGEQTDAPSRTLRHFQRRRLNYEKAPRVFFS